MDGPSSALFRALKPKSFKDMAALVCSAHNSFSWDKEGTGPVRLEGFLKMLESQAFQKYPCFTRDDFFECLLEEGAERTFAFEVSERIRKGQANPQNLMYDKFKALPIPEELKEVAENYQYLFPRSHCIWTVSYTHLDVYKRQV